MAPFTIKDADELYQVSGWGDGYFDVDGKGQLNVRPLGPDGPRVPLIDIVEQQRGEGGTTPLVIRFPQILRQRVDRIHTAFADAIRTNEAKGVRYRGVFPVKVNQRKEVVQEIARAGRRWHHGLEVGSKAELIAALTMDPNRKSLLIVNGFKDKAFLEAACHATAFKDDVVIVLDEVGELPDILPLLDRLKNPPKLGMRLKLRSKAPGKWALSGGADAKFGLTVPEALWAVDALRESGHLHLLQMVHFHIGSQISQIRRIAEGVREAARMAAELMRLEVPVRLIDVGGGLAVDYDGAASSNPNSANYTMEEYANTVVATIKDVCTEAGVPVPDIISESGRALVTHHAVLVTDVIRQIPGRLLPPEGGVVEGDPTPLIRLHEVIDELDAKNCFESFHDILQLRDDLYALFDLGHLDLTRLARTERLLRAGLEKAKGVLEAEEETESEEYAQARRLLGQKHVCNLSIFQSLPDAWGVKQQFPVMPIHRLRERPSQVATVADITCDSDGEIRRFNGPLGTRDELPVHDLEEGKPYYIAFCLVGAYQDSLGDYHNLFGETSEVSITVDDDWEVGRTHDASRVQDMLQWVQYDPVDLRRRLKRRITRLKESGRISATEARELQAQYMQLMDSSTYLEARR